ncbi:MAG: GlsB/YeaQ/YmgE family stress response membrane protein [Sinobacteraceae bacterium]|nr:GlsB/YeaQ/YmgE family stress response membrane protein [Nevskiaceae bacterium]MCP5339996.1 GlsB/YeaQ/YmgE family stress response membrane protein [Nevskiaceae bacterium]MCP5359341.1 GlsB/YeaQ/YmgE family stress response membrane protein [Nevskiaceae bacterium]MCP5467458.1 GlsB/YeaQ/YmgE family stress response membrane protein [Nevskiaceae bacterium]MCP5470778.1 GlsB/YeaQ/YmgE family stress response membrane protein [Nevskiaceae bacterium]
MGFIIWLVVGGVVGWIASLIMQRDAQQGIFLNVIVGIVGAFLGGLLISPLIGVATINQGISIPSILVSLGGAVILLAIINFFTRGRAR